MAGLFCRPGGVSCGTAGEARTISAVDSPTLVAALLHSAGSCSLWHADDKCGICLPVYRPDKWDSPVPCVRGCCNTAVPSSTTAALAPLLSAVGSCWWYDEYRASMAPFAAAVIGGSGSGIR
jgi:hypothetical protein